MIETICPTCGSEGPLASDTTCASCEDGLVPCRICDQPLDVAIHDDACTLPEGDVEHMHHKYEVVNDET